MSTDQLLLIDLSGIAHMVWHVSGNEPDQSFVSRETVARVRALAAQHPYAAVCCDDGRSFRADIDPTYKANRDTENRAPLRHQMDLACETLKRDGFPIWRVRGFEADDLIATATSLALAIDQATVLIASSDKDLLQLVNERVSAKSIRDGSIAGPHEVRAKFGVTPTQMQDYLCLVGDASDNIKGADGIGAVKAARLLSEHGSLDAIYAKMSEGVVSGITPALRTSLMEFKERWPTVRQLIALRTDAPIPFEEIAAERVAAPMVVEPSMEPMGPDSFGGEDGMPTPAAETIRREIAASMPPAGPLAGSTPATVPQQPERSAETPSADFTLQLEPRTIQEAKAISKILFDSTLFSQFPNEQSVFAVLLAGRAEGLKAIPSMHAFHPTQKIPMAADMIRAKVVSSGKAKYFRCSERTPERATFETQRGDDPPVTLTYTMADARLAFQPPKYAKTEADIEQAWQAGNYRRNPADMLVARAGAKLARLVYPDVVAGLYAPEEME